MDKQIIVNTEALIKARGLQSRGDVAKAIGRTEAQVGQYENGVCNPSLPILVKLAELYRTTIDKLVN